MTTYDIWSSLKWDRISSSRTGNYDKVSWMLTTSIPSIGYSNIYLNFNWIIGIYAEELL